MQVVRLDYESFLVLKFTRTMKQIIEAYHYAFYSSHNVLLCSLPWKWRKKGTVALNNRSGERVKLN